ncbi:MAG TPA: DUF952 domain-containing protein [Acidimicrobiales bacterium]|nr:DUF952 domain-containing protein [Acidimicrobiales bacterium]
MAIFHLATPEQWAAAQASGTVAPPSLATEGFVHCSTDDQLDGTIERHFAGVDELLLLRLHEEGLGDDLRWEESRPGERYPHLYRAIELPEVAEAIPWRRGAEEPA